MSYASASLTAVDATIEGIQLWPESRRPTRRNFHRWFKARAEKAGVPVILVHATRRTCASLLAALGLHPRVAMAIMRHSTVAVTVDIDAPDVR